MQSSNYINNQRKEYSLYVLQSRAIPAASDGLKAAARRVLWMARDGKPHKSASLAGLTMSIHPHAAPEGAINTLAAPYGNNIPLLTGDGAFGTLMNPTAYGASRYTSVKVSQFTKDVMFKDIEIIPMVDNYDGTIKEPKHFLPLIPTVLLNPSEGIAVGFASTILPRDIENIIISQIMHLQGRKFDEPYPYFVPTSDEAVDVNENKWTFDGKFKKINSTTIKVISLPYGMLHGKFINKLFKLEEDSIIVDFADASRDIIDIDIKFKRGIVDHISRKEMLKKLNLKNNVTENMNILNFNGLTILSTNYNEVIQKFSDWRLTFYKNRYQRLKELLQKDIQRYKDIITAIKKNVGGMAKKINSRSELKEFLKQLKIINIDYIADLSVYRFTQEEKIKVEQKLQQANEQLKTYNVLLGNKNERKKLYIKELKEVLKKYNDGKYDLDV